MSYNYPEPKSVIEILSELQVNLAADQMLGEGILEIKVTPHFFDKLKMELVTKENKAVVGGYQVFKGLPNEVREFEKWDETELHLPFGSVYIRTEYRDD
jgi:hypothetical protein